MRGCNKKTAPLISSSKAIMPAVRVESISKRFGVYEAVSSLSFNVAKGTILGFVGSDGAGKTTLLRMIATMLKPSAGEIFINGRNVVTDKARIKSLIGYMPQRFGLYQDLSVEENLNFFMDIFGISGSERKKRRDLYLGFSNLDPFVNRLVRDLSGGMKQKLGLACVLVHQPEVLILDEPTNGVDPVSRQEFWGILAKMRQEGMTILVSTAYLDEGEKCDRIVLMHNARALKEAAPKDFLAGFPDMEAAMIHHIQSADEALADEHFRI